MNSSNGADDNLHFRSLPPPPPPPFPLPRVLFWTFMPDLAYPASPLTYTGNGGLGFRPLSKVVRSRWNQSIRHWVWHELAKVKRTVKIQRGRYWDDWYVSPFPNSVSLCILHASCDIAR